MSDKIEYNDLFADDAFSKAVTGMEGVLNAFKLFQTELKSSLSTQKEFFNGFKAKSFEDINKLNEAVARAEQTLKSYAQTNNAVKQSEIELEKIKQEKIKTQKAELDLAKKIEQTKPKQLTLYQQESKILRDLKNEYKNVALAQGQMSSAAQALLAKITPLDAKLKSLDKTTGDNFRNVGNYSSGLISFQNGLTNVLGAAGIGVGLSAGFDFLKQSFAEFAKAEKATKELGFALQNVSGEGAPALERLSAQAQNLEETLGLFENEDIMLLQKELVNLGASSEQVEKLTPKILDLAKASGMDLATATDVAIKAINGQTKGLKSVGLEFADTGSKAENYNILLDKLDKFQGAAANSATTLEGKQQRMAIAWGNIKEAVGEYLVTAGSQLLDSFDVLTGKMTSNQQSINMLGGYFEEYAKKVVSTNNVLRERNKIEAEYNAIFDDTNLSLKQKNERGEYLLARLNALNKAVAAQNAINNQKKPKGLTGGTADQNSSKETKKKVIEETGTWEEAVAAQNEQIRKDQEQLDFEYDQAKKERDQKQRDEDFEAAQKEADRLTDLEIKEEEERIAREEARREQELKDLADLAQKSLAIAEKGINAKQKKIDEALDKEISANEKNIDRQRELADKGLSNTLAFEEEKAALLERKKEDEAKKVLKREKTLAFFSLFAANAKQDPNTALQKTLVEFAIGSAIPAAFIDGTENVGKDKQFNKNKFSNKEDGYIARFDGDERIINPADNAKIGNMSNEDLTALAYNYQNGLMTKYAITDSMQSVGMSNIHASAQLNQLVTLNKNIHDLKDIIKNKKEVSFAIDNIGNVVRTQIENGIRINETRKRI